MPWAKLRLDADCEGGLLHALVNLKQMRMCFADANPDNFRSFFGGKHSDPGDRQKERAEFNRA
jgi:hypothetical protein